MDIYTQSVEKLELLCQNNKYTKWYFNIVKRAIDRKWDKTHDGYTEKHHILPKSIETNNIVIHLTAREHFICHLLLPKMLIDGTHNRKMVLALPRLIHGNKNKVYFKSSKIYETIKQMHSIAAKERSTIYWSDIPKEERSQMRSGEKNSRYGKEVSVATREKISIANKGRLAKEKHPLWNKGHSEETKKTMSENAIISGRSKGKNNPMYGKLGAAHGKKLYHDPINKIEKYFTVGTQPQNFMIGRIKR
jgi:hypothetical protein